MNPRAQYLVGKVLVLVIVITMLVSCGKKAGSGGGAASANVEEEFLALMNSGKNYLDKGSSTQAVIAFEKAVKLQATQGDAHLNLANASLLAGNAEGALKEA